MFCWNPLRSLGFGRNEVTYVLVCNKPISSQKSDVLVLFGLTLHRTHKHAFSNTIIIVNNKDNNALHGSQPCHDEGTCKTQWRYKLSVQSLQDRLAIVKSSENVRSINQGTLYVDKQKLEWPNINILGISELKWMRICEFNSDHQYLLLWARIFYKEWTSSHSQQKSLQYHDNPSLWSNH